MAKQRADEDERFGERRGDELPEHLASGAGRAKWQAATNEQQIVIAAELTNSSADFGQIEPMVSDARRELHAAGVADVPGVVVADAGLHPLTPGR